MYVGKGQKKFWGPIGGTSKEEGFLLEKGRGPRVDSANQRGSIGWLLSFLVLFSNIFSTCTLK